MKNYSSLNHTRWDCKYHVVFIPKRRKKQIYGPIRKHLGEIFHDLAKQKESKIEEVKIGDVVAFVAFCQRQIETGLALLLTLNPKTGIKNLIHLICPTISDYPIFLYTLKDKTPFLLIKKWGLDGLLHGPWERPAFGV